MKFWMGRYTIVNVIYSNEIIYFNGLVLHKIYEHKPHDDMLAQLEYL